MGQLLSEKSYKKGVLEGEYIDYYKNGQVQNKKFLKTESLMEGI